MTDYDVTLALERFTSEVIEIARRAALAAQRIAVNAAVSGNQKKLASATEADHEFDYYSTEVAP